MPTKLNRAGKQQSYVPAGNGDKSGEYNSGSSTASVLNKYQKDFEHRTDKEKQDDFNALTSESHIAEVVGDMYDLSGEIEETKQMAIDKIAKDLAVDKDSQEYKTIADKISSYMSENLGEEDEEEIGFDSSNTSNDEFIKHKADIEELSADDNFDLDYILEDINSRNVSDETKQKLIEHAKMLDKEKQDSVLEEKKQATTMFGLKDNESLVNEPPVEERVLYEPPVVEPSKEDAKDIHKNFVGRNEKEKQIRQMLSTMNKLDVDTIKDLVENNSLYDVMDVYNQYLNDTDNAETYINKLNRKGNDEKNKASKIFGVKL